MSFFATGSLSGLTSIAITVPATDAYQVAGTLTLPTITEGASANSQCVVTVQVGVTTVYTGPAGQEGFSVLTTATAGQVITITTSSSAAVDQPSGGSQPPVRMTYTIDERTA